jgi:hypothetical protein
MTKRNVGIVYQIAQHHTTENSTVQVDPDSVLTYWLQFKTVRAAGNNEQKIWRTPPPPHPKRQQSFTSCKQEQIPARRELGLKVNTKRQSKQQPCESQRGAALGWCRTDRHSLRRVSKNRLTNRKNEATIVLVDVFFLLHVFTSTLTIRRHFNRETNLYTQSFMRCFAAHSNPRWPRKYNPCSIRNERSTQTHKTHITVPF